MVENILGPTAPQFSIGRVLECKKCNYMKEYRCTFNNCGCFISVIVQDESKKCPIDKWGAYDESYQL